MELLLGFCDDAAARRLGLLALMTWTTLAHPLPSAGAPAVTKPASTPKRHAYSIEDSPGYVRAVDPESSSVRLGRRLDAPRVSQLFQGGAPSLDALGRAVCRALHHGNADSLRLLCVRMDEFRDILWPEFPQSRPATGLTSEDAWRVLDVRLLGGCNGAVREHGGHHLEFLRFEHMDSTAVYKNFRLHNGLMMVAKNDAGEVERFGWLRSVAERKGRFKIYSMRD